MKLARRPLARVLVSLLWLAALGSAGVVHAQSALDNVLKSKTIKIAIPTDYPPYGSVGTDMQPKGLDIDMARLIAEKLGVKVELIPVTSANRIPYLQTHKADLVISTLGKNAEREKVIDFTAAYSPFFQAVFAAKNVSIKSFSDLTGKSVAVTRGAMEDQELMKVAPPNLDVKRFEDNTATLSAFVAGQTQAIATNAAAAGTIMASNPGLKTEFKLLLKTSPNFIGVAKGEDALRSRVDAIVIVAKKSGDLDKLALKWLGRPAGELPL
ncbi:MAG: transporter substrate-binding domain-containing protein [Pseudomonadota bacterium]